MIDLLNTGGAPLSSARQTLTGGAIVAADIRLPGMLHCAVVRTKGPRAQLRGVNLAEAKKSPGVAAAVALTYDLPQQVDFAGQIVAAVCAETMAVAEKAASRIALTMDSLEPLLDAEAAFDEARPAARAGGNIVGRAISEHGDVDGAMAKASQVLMARFSVPAASLVGIEPSAFVAAPDERGGLILWTNRGEAFSLRGRLARLLGLAPAKLRVIGLGGQPAGQVERAAAWCVCRLAQESGRPVRLVLPLADDVASGCRRPACIVLGRVGVDDAGGVMALDLDVIVDGGAAHDAPEDVAALVGAHVYQARNQRCRVRQVFTNTPPALLEPGACADAVNFAVEGLLSEAARQLDLDPLALRLANVAPGGRLAQCLRRAAEAVAAVGKRPGRGVGVACFQWPAPVLDAGAPLARVERCADGVVNVFVGGGQPETLRRLVAEAMGVKADDVRLFLGDTALAPQPPDSPDGHGEAAVSLAVLDACAALQKQEGPAMALGVAKTAAPLEPCLGVQVATLEADAETGQRHAVELTTVLAAGASADAMVVQTQALAGVALALLAGAGDAEAYRLPLAADCPRQSVILLSPAEGGAAPSVVEIGRGPALGVAPALAAALAQAVGAVAADLPITPERVLRAQGRIR